LANLRPGEPVFRGVTKGGEIGRDRLTDRSVALIIKKEVGPVPLRLAAARRTRTPWRSGHSLRAGLHGIGDGGHPRMEGSPP
jgi:hypothetical protein